MKNKKAKSSKSTGTEKNLIGKFIQKEIVSSNGVSLNLEVKFKAFNKHELSFTVTNNTINDTRQFATLSRACEEYENASKVPE